MWCVHVWRDGEFKHATPDDGPIMFTFADWFTQDADAATDFVLASAPIKYAPTDLLEMIP
jgi:hypothetical protein